MEVVIAELELAIESPYLVLEDIQQVKKQLSFK